jgi:hypothetical protein
MADSQLIERLRAGWREWNDWRKLNPRLPLDLSAADLRGANLARIDLSGVDLYRAGLVRANLTGSDLRDAELASTNLTGANFTNADLSGANLAFADLNETIFINTNLSRAKGLDLCSHYGPSSIDARTIGRSGDIPKKFLRGCGLPDNYIAAAAAKTEHISSCFISYSTADQTFSERLYSDLQDSGVRCWFAPHHIRGGKKLSPQIDDAIRHHDRLLLILSAQSMKSDWVQTEIKLAREREIIEKRQMLYPITLVPYSQLETWTIVDGVTGQDLAREIREYFIPDFSKWEDEASYRSSFARLLQDFVAG